MTQLSLDSWTTRRASVESLEALSPATVSNAHRLILAALAKGPASDQELLEATGIHPNAIRARRGELHEAGLICIAGKKPNRAGRNVTTWRVR